jgi:hypothetical protein
VLFLVDKWLAGSEGLEVGERDINVALSAVYMRVVRMDIMCMFVGWGLGGY